MVGLTRKLFEEANQVAQANATLWCTLGPTISHSLTRGYYVHAPPDTCIVNCGQTASVNGMIALLYM